MAYVVVDIERADLERAAGDSEMLGSSVERHGTRFLARGRPVSILAGDREPGRLVVNQFESAQGVGDWYASEDDRAACTVREDVRVCRMVVGDCV